MGLTDVGSNKRVSYDGRTTDKPTNNLGEKENQNEVTSLHEQVAQLQEALKKSRAEVHDLQRDKNTMSIKTSSLLEELKKSHAEAGRRGKDLRDKLEREKLNAIQQRNLIIIDLLTCVAKSEREEARVQLRSNSLRLGKIITVRSAMTLKDIWEGGEAWIDIKSRKKNLLERRAALVKLLNSRKPLSGKDEQSLIEGEIYEDQLMDIRTRLEKIQEEESQYGAEKKRFIQELNRIKVEDVSRFNSYPVLKDRYVVLNLLGKGGFCEVFKAFDLMDLKYVVCRFQQQCTNTTTSDRTMRRMIREQNVHKGLSHPNIVKLLETFEFDKNTFCSVLEYCSGKDLVSMLSKEQFLSERRAKIIIIQVFRGLFYLNRDLRHIIHYDLKPANVLFDELGCVKISDFGLCKVVENNDQDIELSSPGAGTCWYLPPECFTPGNVSISSKVDVWSAGIMFYQMLYGKLPFGDGQSRNTIYNEGVILNARNVEFPLSPTVSDEAKVFIKRCLTYDQVDRPEVSAIVEDPYLKLGTG